MITKCPYWKIGQEPRRTLYLAAIASAAPATTTSIPNASRSVEEYIDQYVDQYFDQYFDQNFDETKFRKKFPNIAKNVDEIMSGITEFHEYPNALRKIEDYGDQYFSEKYFDETNVITHVRKHFPNMIKSLEENIDQNFDEGDIFEGQPGSSSTAIRMGLALYAALYFF